ncbi:MAG: hypothetical protein ACYTAF_15095, partial [Planctomycetota bacterium]
MRSRGVDRRLPGRLLGRLLSVPLLVKIMGTGFLVALIFGSVMLFQIRTAMSRTMHHSLEEAARAHALALAVQVEGAVVTGDVFTVTNRLEEAIRSGPEVRYIIVEGPGGRILAHTFSGRVPGDLAGRRPADGGADEAHMVVYGSRGGLIFEAAEPLVGGNAGRIRVGISDAMVARDLAAITWRMLLTLGLCMVIGLGLALVLSYIVTRPARNLLLATNRVGQGDFAARARVF